MSGFNFFNVLLKLKNVVDVLKEAGKLQAELTDGDSDPIDLAPIAKEIRELLSDFGITLPAWANEDAVIVTFFEGGFNAVQAHKP